MPDEITFEQLYSLYALLREENQVLKNRIKELEDQIEDLEFELLEVGEYD